MSTPLTFPKALDALSAASGLTPEIVEQSVATILGGHWTSAQIAGFLIGLRLRGETASVVTAATRAMRRAMIPVHHTLPTLLDTCGTGGDGSGTVNLSTGAAIIVSAAGVPVAKHGNRAASSKCGSADVLSELGVVTELPAAAAVAVLNEVDITFMLAPVFHPAMRFAGPPRRELGVRTLFNCLGPLANPARATHQLIGAYDDRLRPIMAETLRDLGIHKAWVVRGEDGLDEISPYTATRVTEATPDGLREFELTPLDFGLTKSDAGAAAGGDAEENAHILREVLLGRDHPSKTAFVLNAAAALALAKGLELKAATAQVLDTLASGAAERKLKAWAEATQRYAATTKDP